MYVLAYTANGQSGWGRRMSVKETIEIIAIQRDASPMPVPSMSTPGNVTSVSSPDSSSTQISLLWIPYVLIALVFIVFLGANFWCYHKKHRERYLRKRDEKRVKDGLHERRRITALMRSHFQSAFMSKNDSEEFADDGEDDANVAENGASTFLHKSGSIRSVNSKLSADQLWLSGGKTSPVRSSSAVDKLSTMGSAHTLFPSRSVSIPHNLPPGQLWSTIRLSPSQSLFSSPGSVSPGDLTPAEQLSRSQSLSPNNSSPDHPSTPQDKLSSGLLGTLPSKLSHCAPFTSHDKLSARQSVSPDKLSPSQTCPPNKLPHGQSRCLSDKQSPVQPVPAPKTLAFSQTRSADQLPSVQSSPADKHPPGQAFSPSDKLSPGQFCSANKLSSGQISSSGKLPPSQSWSSSVQSSGEPIRGWTNQSGSCRVNVGGGDMVCDIKQDTSNGSVVR